MYGGIALFQLTIFEQLSLATTYIEAWIDESES